MSQEERVIAGYGKLAEFLTEHGFTISKGTVSKYCSPAINIGPPIEGWWSQKPIFSPSKVLAWARNRMTASKEAA